MKTARRIRGYSVKARDKWSTFTTGLSTRKQAERDLKKLKKQVDVQDPILIRIVEIEEVV